MINNGGFINAMNATAKTIESSVIIDDVEYSGDNLISLNPYFSGELLKSIMRCCSIELAFDEEIDSSVATALQGKKVTQTRVGAMQLTDEDYSYIDYGEYTVYSAEYREETNSVFLTCYDEMLSAMVPFNLTTSGTFTVKAFLQAICSHFGWTLANVPFANENFVLSADVLNAYYPIVEQGEQPQESSYTFRDVLDDIAEMIGGNLIFKNGVLIPLYPDVVRDVQDEVIQLNVDNQKNISFYEQFGEINSVHLVDNESGSTVNLSDSESVEENGEHKIVIEDNPLINFNREGAITAIFNKLNGFTFTPFEFTSYAYGYMEFGDMFDLEDKKGNVKRAVLLNDNILYSSTAIKETASALAPESEQKYIVKPPIQKAKVEIQQLKNQGTQLNERILEALDSIAKTTDGHAVLVDLEFNEDTGKYYAGDGEADTVIVSENPAVGTPDWNTGRVIRINYNGIAVSTTGIGGPYVDFAIYYDDDKGIYRVNANDITAGTLQGININFDNGEIGGWIVETEETSSATGYDAQIRQTLEIGSYIYDVILKNDGAKDSDKKTIYANRYVTQSSQNAMYAHLNYEDESWSDERKYEEGAISFTLKSNLEENYGTTINDIDGNPCTADDTIIFDIPEYDGQSYIIARYRCTVSRNSKGNIASVGIVRYWLDENENLIRGDSQSLSDELTHSGQNVIIEGNRNELFYIRRNGKAAFDNITYLNDTGWVDVNYTSDFEDYSSGQKLQYRLVGNTIRMRGACKSTDTLAAGDTHTIFRLPSGYRPTSQERFLCQGTSGAIWLLTINTDGYVTLSRYRNAGTAYIDIEPSYWLAFTNVSFYID